MAVLSRIKIKELTATGAVSTDNVPGILYYALFTSTNAGDKVAISDGATNRITLLAPANNYSVEFKPNVGSEPIFSTDIAATITKAGTATATFIYREIV